MNNLKPSGILKYFFRHAIINAFYYSNNRQQLHDSISTTFSIMIPVVDKISKSNVETIHLFTSMLESVCKHPAKNKSDSNAVLFQDVKIIRMIEALNMLSDFERQVIVLHDIEIFSNKEIALLYSCKVRHICELTPCLLEKLTINYSLLWPFVNDTDITEVRKILLNLRNCIDEKFLVETILDIKDLPAIN